MKLPPAVVVHGAAHVRLALAAGQPALLISAPGAAGYAGVLWWRCLIDGQGAPYDALDCEGQPGRALEALANGCRIIVLPPCPASAEVQARAGAALVLEARPPALDLAEPGAARLLGAWLRGDSATRIS